MGRRWLDRTEDQHVYENELFLLSFLLVLLGCI